MGGPALDPAARTWGSQAPPGWSAGAAASPWQLRQGPSSSRAAPGATEDTRLAPAVPCSIVSGWVGSWLHRCRRPGPPRSHHPHAASLSGKSRRPAHTAPCAEISLVCRWTGAWRRGASPAKRGPAEAGARPSGLRRREGWGWPFRGSCPRLQRAGWGLRDPVWVSLGFWTLPSWHLPLALCMRCQ